MKVRTLDLGFLKVPRLSQLNCKTCQFWSTDSRLISLSGLTTYGPKPWGSLELSWLTVMGWMLVRWHIEILKTMYFNWNIISRNWLQANPGVQVPGWSLSSLQTHWWFWFILQELSTMYTIVVLGEGHGTGPTHSVVQQVMREMILGEKWAMDEEFWI